MLSSNYGVLVQIEPSKCSIFSKLNEEPITMDCGQNPVAITKLKDDFIILNRISDFDYRWTPEINIPPLSSREQVPYKERQRYGDCSSALIECVSSYEEKFCIVLWKPGSSYFFQWTVRAMDKSVTGPVKMDTTQEIGFMNMLTNSKDELRCDCWLL